MTLFFRHRVTPERGVGDVEVETPKESTILTQYVFSKSKRVYFGTLKNFYSSILTFLIRINCMGLLGVDTTRSLLLLVSNRRTRFIYKQTSPRFNPSKVTVYGWSTPSHTLGRGESRYVPYPLSTGRPLQGGVVCPPSTTWDRQLKGSLTWSKSFIWGLQSTSKNRETPLY